MLAEFDYYGAAALVAAIGAIISSILAFMARQPAKAAAQHAEAAAAALTTSNGHTVANLVERAEARATGEPAPPDVIVPPQP